MYHSVAIVAIYTPIKLIWSLKGDSLQERGKKRQIFSLPPSLFPAHVQLLTALTTPPPRWKQRQTERRQFKMREMLYQTSNLLRVCSPLPDRLICGCLRLMEGFQSKKKHQQQKNLKIFRLKVDTVDKNVCVFKHPKNNPRQLFCFLSAFSCSLGTRWSQMLLLSRSHYNTVYSSRLDYMKL